MSLRRIPGRMVWIFQTKVNGKTFSRSTGERDKRKAMKKVPALQKLAETYRAEPESVKMLSDAITREIHRIKEEGSEQQAERAKYGFQSFNDFAGNVRIEKINMRLLERFQVKRLKKASKSTVDRELHLVGRLLKQNGFTIEKPSAKRGKATMQRAFTDKELNRFFHVCPDRLFTLYYTMLVSGARLAELVPSKRSNHIALLKSEVDFDQKIIRLRTAKQKLNASTAPTVPRIIKIPELLEHFLKMRIAETEGKFVFKPLKISSRDFDVILRRARIEKLDALGAKLTAHSFRHTYATLVATQVGNNPFMLKAALGHKQIQTTERYCHPKAPAIEVDFLTKRKTKTESV